MFFITVSHSFGPSCLHTLDGELGREGEEGEEGGEAVEQSVEEFGQEEKLD